MSVWTLALSSGLLCLVVAMGLRLFGRTFPSRRSDPDLSSESVETKESTYPTPPKEIGSPPVRMITIFKFKQGQKVDLISMDSIPDFSAIKLQSSDGKDIPMRILFISPDMNGFFVVMFKCKSSRYTYSNGKIYERKIKD